MIWRSGKLWEGKEITLNTFHEKHLRFPLYVIRRQQWGNIRLVILWCSPANFHQLCNLGTPETLQLLRYQVPQGSSLFYVLATHPAQEPPDSFSMYVCTLETQVGILEFNLKLCYPLCKQPFRRLNSFEWTQVVCQQQQHWEDQQLQMEYLQRTSFDIFPKVKKGQLVPKEWLSIGIRKLAVKSRKRSRSPVWQTEA